MRGIGGSSSGAIAAWTVAWHRPNEFRKVLSNVGSFTNIRGGHEWPDIIAKEAKKPIRIHMVDGRNDNRGIRRGGGDIHRIHNRDYSFRLPRKALQAATRMALAAKVRDDELMVIDDLAFAEPRTRDMASILKHLDWNGQSLLVATEKHDTNVYRSARNIAGVSVSPAGDLNALDVLSSRRLLVTKAALDSLLESAKKNGKTAEAAAKV